MANSGAKNVDGIFIVTNGKLEELVAFSPNQIKSATGNTGAFDAGAPDIRFSKKEKGLKFSRVSESGTSSQGIKFSAAAEKQYEKDQDSLWQQATDLFFGVLKYRKDKGDGALEDVSAFSHLFATTMYKAEKVGGAAKRAFGGNKTVLYTSLWV